MPTYQAPLRDIKFVLHELLDIENSLLKLPGQDGNDAELVDAVLGAVAKISEERLFPLNQIGDQIGCLLENGVVRTPPGFKEAYRLFTQNGFAAIAGEVGFGGQGLPKTVNLFADEIVASANMSFGLYLILTFGAYLCISECASDGLKRTYLPRLLAGDWTGTMCLTEPQCGTDLGLSRTMAKQIEDGTYRVNGTKIFITAGEHDMSQNIIHLVLARTPAAPDGVKGISLFLVPKYLVNSDGTLGQRNGVIAGSIEEKMGTHAAPTCVLNFDNAVGYLLGDLHRGVRNMFTMMNHERLVVGIQGLAQGEVAYQNALAYAKDRLQSRALDGVKAPDKPADPIIVHPDVRRMLLTAKAYNEGARAFAGWMGVQIDYTHHHPDPEVRKAAGELVALLTPVVKGVFTDNSGIVTSSSLQVLGGHGYIKEWGMEQYMRDARITQIYEGTNGIQALDLVARKLPMNGGSAYRRYFKLIESFVAEQQGNESMQPFITPLSKSLLTLQKVTDSLLSQEKISPIEVGAAATDYMRLLGLVSLGFMWAKMAFTASARLGGQEKDFYQAKMHTARFFCERILPEHFSLSYAIQAGAEPLMVLAEEGF